MPTSQRTQSLSVMRINHGEIEDVSLIRFSRKMPIACLDYKQTSDTNDATVLRSCIQTGS